MCRISQGYPERRLHRRGDEYEYKVRWEGYSTEYDSWEGEGTVAGDALNAFETERARGGQQREWQDGEEQDGREERSMAYRMFSSVQDKSLSRATSDCAYSCLADALAVGKSGRCCKTGDDTGRCDLAGVG